LLPKSLDEQIAGLENLISGKRGLQLASFLLFADFYLIKTFQVNLLSLNWEWAKSNLAFGGLAAMLFFFLLFAGLLTPWIQALLLLPSYIGSEIFLNRLVKKEGDFLGGVKDHELLHFAIAEGNSIAYQEYLRKQQEVAEHIVQAKWVFVFLCSLGLNAFASEGASESLLEFLWTALGRLPAWLYYVLVVALATWLLLLLSGSLITFRFMGKYHLVNPRVYQMIQGAKVGDKEKEIDPGELENA